MNECHITPASTQPDSWQWFHGNFFRSIILNYTASCNKSSKLLRKTNIPAQNPCLT